MVERALNFLKRRTVSEPPVSLERGLPMLRRGEVLGYLMAFLGRLTRSRVEQLGKALYADILNNNERSMADIWASVFLNDGDKDPFREDTFLNHVALVYRKDEMEFDTSAFSNSSSWHSAASVFAGGGPARPLLLELYCLQWQGSVQIYKDEEEEVFIPGRHEYETKKYIQKMYGCKRKGLEEQNILVLVGEYERGIKTKPTKEDLEANIVLSPNGIYPTEMLREFIKNNGDINELVKLRGQTHEGRLDPNNSLQKELEYGNFVRIRGHKADYKEFSKLEMLPEIGEKEIPQLNWLERMEARAAAFEAARLFWFVKERVDSGRKIAVIGNIRYGSYFVIEPLREYLEQIGAKVSFYRVPSTHTSSYSAPDIFPVSFIDYLIRETPDIVIVDGTSNTHNGEQVRFPKAMLGYLNWFIAFNDAGESFISDAERANRLQEQNEYQKVKDKIEERKPSRTYVFSHWVAQPTDKVSLGDLQVIYRPPANEEPEVIFANPVIEPSQFKNFPPEFGKHKPGFLDDPDSHLNRRSIIGFTPTGLGQLYGGKTEEEFVNLVQSCIVSELPKMLAKTDPLHFDSSVE